jgi:hypothetical protein
LQPTQKWKQVGSINRKKINRRERLRCDKRNNNGQEASGHDRDQLAKLPRVACPSSAAVPRGRTVRAHDTGPDTKLDGSVTNIPVVITTKAGPNFGIASNPSMAVGERSCVPTSSKIARIATIPR